MKVEFINNKQLREIIPIGINQSKKMFRTIEEQFKQDGFKQFVTRPRVLPKDYVIGYLRKEKLI